MTPTTARDLRELLEDHVRERRQCIIAYQNTHGLRVRMCNPAIDALHRLPQTYVYIDGMPLILLCRLRGLAVCGRQRVTGADWIWTLLRRAAEEHWRVYLLGAEQRVLETAVKRIRDRFPTLALQAHHGFFDQSDAAVNASITRSIAAFEPHVILAGMGMGRQERWILDNMHAVSPACIYAVGAWIEHAGGAVRTPPRWMGRYGVEWLFRLAENPRRFWYRYLIEPWWVLAHLIRHVASRQSAPTADSP